MLIIASVTTPLSLSNRIPIDTSYMEHHDQQRRELGVENISLSVSKSVLYKYYNIRYKPDLWKRRINFTVEEEKLVRYRPKAFDLFDWVFSDSFIKINTSYLPRTVLVYSGFNRIPSVMNCLKLLPDLVGNEARAIILGGDDTHLVGNDRPQLYPKLYELYRKKKFPFLV